MTDTRLSAEAAAILEQFRSMLPAGFLPMSASTMSVTEIRAVMDSWPQPPGPELPSVEDRVIPGPNGIIPLRVYHPNPDRIAPVLVWLHGGGFALGSLTQCDTLCRVLAQRTGSVVVSVGYRLAPEHPFPAAHEDAFAATTWVAEHAVDIGGDPAHLMVGGDSAGGTLAAVVAIKARDEGGPLIEKQVLAYASAQPETTNADGGTALLTVEDCEWFWRLYAPLESQRLSPYCSLQSNEDLSGLPPAMVLCADVDPMRDGLETFAHRLAAAGNLTTMRRYIGSFHGFLGMEAVLPAAAEALQDLTDFVSGGSGTDS